MVVLDFQLMTLVDRGYMQLVQTGHLSSSCMLVVGEISGPVITPPDAPPPLGTTPILAPQQP